MQSVMEVFWEIVLAITGAVAIAGITVAAGAFAVGCATVGCACTWRNWRRRLRGRKPD